MIGINRLCIVSYRGFLKVSCGLNEIFDKILVESYTDRLKSLACKSVYKVDKSLCGDKITYNVCKVFVFGFVLSLSFKYT